VDRDVARSPATQLLIGVQTPHHADMQRLQLLRTDMVTVRVEPLGDAAKAPAQAVLEFWNFVLDSEAQRRLELE
jgi:hypothetical protein